VHAALALCHIQKSQGELQQRVQQFAWLDRILPKPYVESISNRHQGNMFRYIIRQPNGADALIHALREHGVGAEKPVQTPYDTALGEACSGAQQAWKDCVSLPVLIHMSEREKQVYKQALEVCC
jgi:dTDP-4-amino-4,6-dideoxygalactose transaminase